LIKIEVVLDKDGILKSCKATGHAGAGKKGSDIVCAAVSVLLRTTLITLSNREGINIKSEAPKPGELKLETSALQEGKSFLYAISVFLLEGLKSIEQEFPKNIELKMIRRN